ncbi:MAG: putative Zn-dependent protease [Porticoccus sp.]|jgi:predicted Zn-dependent protease
MDFMMLWQQTVSQVAAGFCVVFITACSVNPVTGENELSLMSQNEELNVGNQQYSPTQQSQGGQYYLDSELTFYVSSVGKKLAAVSDRPDLPYEFVILNNSVPNAWALPGGKIALNRGLLLELQDEAELAAVLGHEIVHAAARHTAARMTKNQILGIGVAVLGIGLSGNEYQGLILGSAALGSQLVQSKYGRDAELESDYYGMEYMAKAGYDIQGAVELQKTFVRLSKGQQNDIISGLFASHPPSQERVDTNIATAIELGAGGVRNKALYQQRIAQLKRDKPAYQAYDKGRKALQDKDYSAALTFAKTAIAIQPKESIFYELNGLGLEGSGNQKDALASYDQAIKLNNQLFSHYLQRGLLKQTMGDNKGAEADLTASKKLLPTQAAANALGKAAFAQGKTDQAVANLQESAEAGGALGQQSRLLLEKIELPTNPAKYVPTKLGLNSNGYLTVIIGNRASVTITNPVIEILQYNGQWRSAKQLTVKQTIGSGKQLAAIDTGIGPLTPEQAKYYQVRVIKVQW